MRNRSVRRAGPPPKETLDGFFIVIQRENIALVLSAQHPRVSWSGCSVPVQARPAGQPLPFLCLKPCFAPAPFLWKPWLPFFPLDLNDLSFWFRSNFFFLAPNVFSLPPFFAPKLFPAGFVFFPSALSPSLDFFHPLPAWPTGGVLWPALAPLSLPARLAGKSLFRLLALGNMSETKSEPWINQRVEQTTRVDASGTLLTHLRRAPRPQPVCSTPPRHRIQLLPPARPACPGPPPRCPLQLEDASSSYLPGFSCCERTQDIQHQCRVGRWNDHNKTDLFSSRLSFFLATFCSCCLRRSSFSLSCTSFLLRSSCISSSVLETRRIRNVTTSN